eukprot:scaffold77192_cov37-Cyclotella_meneghiniana.AAC.5
MAWFKHDACHPGFKDVILPTDMDCPQVKLFKENLDVESNLDDDEIDPDVENTFEDGQYFFSTAQEPNHDTSVFQTSDQFAMAMMKRSAPTLLTYGGNYANMRELAVENVLPFAFPYGTGGPKCRRRSSISYELCIQRYFRTAMSQFMRSDVILVLHHMYSRQLSFRSGVMTCRSSVNGKSVGETLAEYSILDFERNMSTVDSSNQNDSSNMNPTPTNTLMKAISTLCKSLGFTDHAAKEGRQKHFSVMDLFGVNSLFLTVSPCDECSFRVRLFAKPNEWHMLPSPDCSESECIMDFELRKKLRCTYPGACSLEYQNLMNILIEDLLQWDLSNKCSKGIGILGRVIGFARADED